MGPGTGSGAGAFTVGTSVARRGGNKRGKRVANARAPLPRVRLHRAGSSQTDAYIGAAEDSAARCIQKYGKSMRKTRRDGAGPILREIPRANGGTRVVVDYRPLNVHVRWHADAEEAAARCIQRYGTRFLSRMAQQERDEYRRWQARKGPPPRVGSISRDGPPCGLLGCTVLTCARPGGAARQADDAPRDYLRSASHFFFCSMEHKRQALLPFGGYSSLAAIIHAAKTLQAAWRRKEGPYTRPRDHPLMLAEAVEYGRTESPPDYSLYIGEVSHIIQSLKHIPASLLNQEEIWQSLMPGKGGGPNQFHIRLANTLLVRYPQMQIDEPCSFDAHDYPLIGCTVAIFGTSSPAFNGKRGLGVAYNQAKERYVVNLYELGSKLVKGQHLVLVDPVWKPADLYFRDNIREEYYGAPLLTDWVPAAGHVYPADLSHEAVVTRREGHQGGVITGVVLQVDHARRTYQVRMEAWKIQSDEACVIYVPFGMLYDLRDVVKQRTRCFECDSPPMRCYHCNALTFCSQACAATPGKTHGHSWYHAAECRALCRARRATFAKPRLGFENVTNQLILGGSPVPQDFLQLYDGRRRKIKYYFGSEGFPISKRYTNRTPPYEPEYETNLLYKMRGAMVKIGAVFSTVNEAGWPGAYASMDVALNVWRQTASAYHLRIVEQAMGYTAVNIYPASQP